MIKAQIIGDRITSNSNEAFSLCERSKFGEKIDERIEYLLVEALYLVSNRKMEVYLGNKRVDFDNLISRARRKDKRISAKFSVFSDLRRKGYIVKSALKFGADFRVYDKGARPSEEHARWLLYSVKESENLKWHEFAAKSRVAHSTKKKLLLGIVDEEGDVLYYEISWMRP